MLQNSFPSLPFVFNFVILNSSTFILWYLGFMSCLEKPFLVQNYKATFFCSLFHSVGLICFHLSLIHLECIIEFEARVYTLFLKGEPTVPNCLLNNLLAIPGWESPSHCFSFGYFLLVLFHTFIIAYTC